MQEIDVNELAQKLRDGALQVVDVREAWELEQCALPDAIHLPLSRFNPDFQERLDPDQAYAILCHHGGRSAQATAFLAQHGFTNVCNVVGGIDAWALQVDPQMARY